MLEAPDQRAVGIEIKASASLTQGDFDGLRELRRAAGRTFTRGVVLHTGEQLLPFEDDLWTVPLGVLWAGGGVLRFGGPPCGYRPQRCGASGACWPTCSARCLTRLHLISHLGGASHHKAIDS